MLLEIAKLLVACRLKGEEDEERRRQRAHGKAYGGRQYGKKGNISSSSAGTKRKHKTEKLKRFLKGATGSFSDSGGESEGVETDRLYETDPPSYHSSPTSSSSPPPPSSSSSVPSLPPSLFRQRSPAPNGTFFHCPINVSLFLFWCKET